MLLAVSPQQLFPAATRFRVSLVAPEHCAPPQEGAGETHARVRVAVCARSHALLGPASTRN